MSAIKILHIENLEKKQELVSKFLKEKKFDFTYLAVDNVQDFTSALKIFKPNVVIGDYAVPQFSAFEALEILNVFDAIPFILLTETAAGEFALHVLKFGATDFLTVDRLQRLPIAINNSIEKNLSDKEKQDSFNRVAASERKFRRLLENEAGAILILNPEGEVSYVSLSLHKILGYEEEEILKKRIRDFIHPENIDDAQKQFTTCVSQPGVSLNNIELRIKHKNGSWRWMDTTLSNLLDDPDIAGLVNNFHDITERKITENLIKRSEEKYKSFFENTLDGILLTEPNGRTLSANPAACKIFGRTEEEIIEAGRKGLVDESDPRLFVALKERESKGKVHFEVNMLRQNGAKFPAELTSSIFKDECGQLRSTIIVRDISQRKIIEQELKSSKEKYELLFKNSPLPNWVFEENTFKILDVNCAAIKQYGYSREEFLSMTILDLRPKNEIDHLINHINNVEIVNGIFRFGKFTHRKKNGSLIKVEVYGHNITFDSKSCRLVVILDITEKELALQAREEAEKSLKESNARYKLVSKATSDAIWDWNYLTDHIYWGEGFLSLFGYSEEKLRSDIYGWINLVHPDDVDWVTESLNGAMKGIGSNWQAEYRYKKANGEYAIVLDKGFIIRNKNNEVIRIVGAIRDITEKRKLQNLLDKATTLSRIGSLEMDLITNKVYWSAMTMEIHEVDEDFIPKINSLLSFCKDEEHKNLLFKEQKDAIENNVPFSLEYKIETAKENERWLRLIIEPVIEKFTCVRLNGSVQDISSAKRAEFKILEASKERERILESIGDAFFAVNNDWKITYFNKHAEDLLESSKKEVMGKNLWEIFPDAVNTNFYDAYHKAFNENTIQDFEEYFDRVGKWFDVTAYPSASGLSVYFRDVTARKKSDLKLLELNENLQAYTNELVAANKGLEQFSYMISHNLRSPVANILGVVDVMKQDNYPPEIQEKLMDGLYENVKNLDNVISDLNSILHVKGEISAKKEPIDLQDLIYSIKSSIKDIINREEATIECKLQISSLTTVKSYLYSIFYNLILNSIKYKKPEVAPKLEIIAERREKKVVLQFIDNGLGIDLQKREGQIFGLYKRFHHHIEGKGMGLFMVKTQVEMLGGKIHVESEVDKGTIFTVEFEDEIL